MKKCLSTLAEALLVVSLPLSIVSCSKDDIKTIPSPKEDRVPIEVSVGQDITTKGSINSDKETLVGNLQILVFRKGGTDEGLLDAYGSVQNSSSVELKCTTGEKYIYAIANAQSLKSIKTQTELMNATSSLGYSIDNGFTMIGSCTATITSSNEINISISRIASRIGIQSIKTEFTGTAYSGSNFTVDAIYIVNACTAINYGLDQTPSAWGNRLKYSRDMSAFLYASITDGTIANGESLDVKQYFYTYPNLVAEDSQDKTFTPRFTRLVVEATLGETKCYYPINIREDGGLLSNKSYLIRTLTITRLGSTSPDAPIVTANTPNGVEVVAWADADSDISI